jgi:predicted RNA-binding protein with PIN domain
MSKELFYVAATRGRESLTVITSDKEQLRETIGISAERTSASELARKAGQQVSPGHHRLPDLQIGQSIESARDFALWQSASLAAQERQQGPQQQIEPTLQRQQEEKQKREIDRGYGIGF